MRHCLGRVELTLYRWNDLTTSRVGLSVDLGADLAVIFVIYSNNFY